MNESLHNNIIYNNKNLGSNTLVAFENFSRGDNWVNDLIWQIGKENLVYQF